MDRPRVALAVGAFLLRGFVLFGLNGLPLLVANWFQWRSPPVWMRNVLVVWGFTFGMGLLVIAMTFGVAILLVPLVLADLWVAVTLACFGVRPAMTHFHELCSTLGQLLIGIGNKLQSLEVSFPLDTRRN